MQREKFVNSMLFKHLILANNDKELVKMLSKSEKSFDLFMEILEDAYELDEDFFGIDSSIPSKVLSVLNPVTSISVYVLYILARDLLYFFLLRIVIGL